MRHSNDQAASAATAGHSVLAQFVAPKTARVGLASDGMDPSLFGMPRNLILDNAPPIISVNAFCGMIARVVAEFQTGTGTTVD